MDMDNVVEDDALEAIDEAIDAKAGLANVPYGLAKSTGKLLGGGYKAARSFSSVVKQCGERIAGIEHEAVTEDDPNVQLEEPVDESIDDDAVAFKPSVDLDPDEEEATSGKRATRALVAALESDLKATRAKLEEMRSQAQGANTPITFQLKALQEEKESLLADLEQAKSLAQETILQKEALNERVIALESELATAKEELRQAHDQTLEAQSQLTSQLENQSQLTMQLIVLRRKNESLIADLEKARNEVDQTKTREEQADAAPKPIEGKIVPVITETVSQPTQKEPVEVKGQQVEVTETETPTSADVAVESEPLETEEQQPEALAAEETVKTEAPPAEVTAEELKDAVFDHVTEKIIFTKALSDMTSQDQTARIDAARAIGGIRHELSVRALIARIAIEPIPQVKGEYIKALATLNMKEGLPVIEHALTDQIPSVRLAAVRALYRVAGAESGPMLIRMFYDEDESIRRRAVVCIGWLGKKEFATALVPLLDDSSILVRQATIEAMVNLCSKMVVSALIDHLGDPEKAIRKAIVAALKSITGKKMSPDAVQSGFPEDEKSIQQLIARWRQWWNTQYPD